MNILNKSGRNDIGIMFIFYMGLPHTYVYLYAIDSDYTCTYMSHYKHARIPRIIVGQ